MSLLVFKPEETIEYVPAYGNNRDSENPCVVGLKYVSFAGVQQYANHYSKLSSGITDPEEINFITQKVQKKQFLDNVKSVAGIFDGPREVINVLEFHDMAPQPLIFELMRAMEDPQKLQAGRLKKLPHTEG